MVFQMSIYYYLSSIKFGPGLQAPLVDVNLESLPPASSKTGEMLAAPLLHDIHALEGRICSLLKNRRGENKRDLARKTLCTNSAGVIVGGKREN